MPYQYFWYETTLHATVSFEEGSKHLVLNLTLGTLLTWVLLFIIIITGLKLSMTVSCPDPGPTTPSLLQILRFSESQSRHYPTPS